MPRQPGRGKSGGRVKQYPPKIIKFPRKGSRIARTIGILAGATAAVLAVSKGPQIVERKVAPKPFSAPAHRAAQRPAAKDVRPEARAIISRLNPLHAVDRHVLATLKKISKMHGRKMTPQAVMEALLREDRNRIFDTAYASLLKGKAEVYRRNAKAERMVGNVQRAREFEEAARDYEARALLLGDLQAESAASLPGSSTAVGGRLEGLVRGRQ